MKPSKKDRKKAKKLLKKTREFLEHNKSAFLENIGGLDHTPTYKEEDSVNQQAINDLYLICAAAGCVETHVIKEMIKEVIDDLVEGEKILLTEKNRITIDFTADGSIDLVSIGCSKNNIELLEKMDDVAKSVIANCGGIIK